MTDLLSMGGHGAYVWSAYGLSLVALIAIGVWPLAAMRNVIRRARRRQALRDHGSSDAVERGHDPAT